MVVVIAAITRFCSKGLILSLIVTLNFFNFRGAVVRAQCEGKPKTPLGWVPPSGGHPCSILAPTIFTKEQQCHIKREGQWGERTSLLLD